MKHVFKKKIQTQGFALILALIISSVVLSIGISILRVSINQLNLSSTARESEISFQSAHAGLGCMQYWRNTSAGEFVPNGVASAPTINCFGEAPTVSSFEQRSDTNGHSNSFGYTFEWGSDFQRCTDMTLFVMVGTDGDYTLNFPNYPTVGTDGVKTCEEGNVCTIIFSRGYNRSCEDLGSSIFSVQRELVIEY